MSIMHIYFLSTDLCPDFCKIYVPYYMHIYVPHYVPFSPQRRKVFKVASPQVAWAIVLRETAKPNKKCFAQAFVLGKGRKELVLCN